MNKELVLVLDFGGQNNQLIARRVRELSVYSEVVPYDIKYEEIIAKNPSALILTGGPLNIMAEDAIKCDPRIFEMEIPILGICYGMQLLTEYFGGEINTSIANEYDISDLNILVKDKLLDGLENEFSVWINQSDSIISVPEGFIVTASSSSSKIAAINDSKRKIYGVQFHPEVKHTNNGTQILKNFLFKICNLKGDWNLADFIDEVVDDVRKKVGNKKVLCGLSGGVDSSVAAALVHKAIGDQLICVFVNNGLMRKGEIDDVVVTFKDKKEMNLVYADAEERFLSRLKGVNDPETKRKIIGEVFIRVFEEEASKLGQIDYLVQGTVYSDIIESGTKTNQTIKSHHNVGGLPDDMQFDLIEPLRLLFKDEVRVIGEKLGLPEEIVWRQPFPGPGLGVRVLEEVTKEKLEILKEADAIVREEIKNAGLNKDIWQAFAVLPPVRSVGVKDSARTYAYPIIIRAVTSEDAMTAKWARLPYELLDTMARRIVNEVDGINRVAYDITSKPPGTIEWE
ncbi:GMP synthase [glutamine-hydrolyzing], amidotransferase subunit [Candidatus Syntrophocurvum alkaliphilum]|uniref:GMP synthase [glutamine-hydrolyzing] n=1 Tax=Candidatus Syntrophocurvum alkaliphilum TaxID=2293317 RepID=A0A6I6D5Z0_9FIRM|nr:glutamine-hydrolyzing GMP synthase [Candidatus Syntrophocurvum alkaliphilum]QGT98766.1 GMP synthase [glutamine-hydrolyzing], amidotransferase subunit [Candidatus Syntrophocurvum alkaliphilum]